MEPSTQWAKSAVRPAMDSIEAFTRHAADLAAGVEDGSVVLTESEKQGLSEALRLFELQANRLRLQLARAGENQPDIPESPG